MTTTRHILVPASATASRMGRAFAGLAAALGAVLLPLGGALAATTPSQTPLYNAVPGAKPNLMFVLDNSGSMDFEAQDGYAVDDNCPKSGWNCGTRYGWYAMRSSSVNTQYYNPAITYAARVNADRSKQINSTTFVDNQSSNNSKPQHETGWTAGAKKFTYVLCKSDICSIEANRTVRIIQSSDTGTVPLPAGHKRTDCGSTTECTAALERQNIANWYEWYRSRALAVSSALGLAMQSYDNKFRVGYTQYNNGGSKASSIVSGVNYFRDEAGATGRKWKTNFYEWIYGINPGGGTPSHNALVLAANYYAGNVTTSITSAPLSSPWKNDPNDLTSGELSCRRAYAIVLSDGAWNAGTAQEIDTRYAATAGSINYDGTPSGNATKFQYDPKGAIGYDSADLAQKLRARNLYIPYIGGSSSNGFADLTARYFWHTDFSGALANNVPTMEGQHNPTFWQNMTTFTIGWGLTPSGEGKSTGLNWGQIEKYNNDWLAGNPVTPPQWATGNLNTGTTDADTARRVDDFIRAGFTGGGRAYSVYSGDDVRRALDNALSSMVGSGNDAGVAVSGNSNEFQTLEGQYKYTTEYQTADNSGDIKAFELDANGGYRTIEAGKPKPAWSANARMPTVDKRTIFALSNYDPNTPATALRTSLTHGTKLSNLPTDLQALLNADKQQASDESFVRYMLGQDPQKAIDGTVYRLRKQPIGASVNSPPVFVGGRFDMGYGAALSSVDGKDSYVAYKALKTTQAPTIFAATNNGKVHVLNAARNEAGGTELAAFMPKGAMAAQIDLANPNFRFRYTLDGPLVEQDVYDKAGDTPVAGKNTWRQLVLGTGGRAGPFIYGLESPLDTANRTPTQNHFLWEVNNKHNDYLGLAHITNNPAAGQLDDGTWVMLTGNGHYPETKKVGLYVVEALTGKRKAFVELPSAFGSGATGGNRGLGGVVAVRDTTRRIVAAYAGDANGNLWRFDLRSAKLTTSVPRRLFTTSGGKAQPIYAAPAWQVHPGDGSTCTYSATSSCGAIVVIGTGILLDEDDLLMPATKQALYGIWDQTPIGGDDKTGAVPFTTSNLVAQTITPLAKLGAGLEGGKNFYQLSSSAVDWNTKKGWLLNLGTITHPGAMLNGERVVGDLANLGSSVIVSSFLPEDKAQGIESCTATGSLPNIIYVLDALTGKNKNSFDVDGNGSFDAYSVVSISGGGFTRGNVNSRNMVGQPNEGHPDGKPRTSCTNETGFLTGVGGTQKAGDGCSDSRTWRRSWRQVVSPPF
ncbi:PilC/PilY family type IV pilus protein [Variovorax sp. EBFNA2]|uniref:pilus assembly protein n=1 Tax=Variovorax sp. EBFNA2 TaxID=3342097 RepID=UPI0029C03C31|nr:PilC/PilY family type IV pilus protein [Variovorax boronicumulans]WPG34837.1 PilC/PilY family type IV pilus protein [Variovorax boronicumulans]